MSRSGKLYSVVLVSAPSITKHDDHVYFLSSDDAEEYSQPSSWIELLDLGTLAESAEDGEEIVIRRETWTRQQLDDVDWGD